MTSSAGFSPVQAILSGGRRHFQQGPIDLVLKAYGPEAEVNRAYDQAWDAFAPILLDLVADLAQLRQPVPEAGSHFTSPTAEAMARAVEAHTDIFVTPMAAVAGAVADTVLSAMTKGRSLEKAFVNNGGDISLYLAPGAELSTGIVTNVDAPALDGFASITSDMAIRGIATSGWRGRSHSMGIADSVTVLAATAAAADVAATLIANATSIEHADIKRTPASDLDPDSDLGGRLVTIDVPVLPMAMVDQALKAGTTSAQQMIDGGSIEAALISLQGQTRAVGHPMQVPNSGRAISSNTTTQMGREAA